MSRETDDMAALSGEWARVVAAVGFDARERDELLGGILSAATAFLGRGGETVDRMRMVLVTVAIARAILRDPAEAYGVLGGPSRAINAPNTLQAVSDAHALVDELRRILGPGT